MKTIRFRARARRDLRILASETARVWGSEQRDTYLAAIDEALRRLAAFPESGVPQDDLAPGLRLLIVRRHAVLYIPQAADIQIVRILHQSMDVSRHLS